MEIEDLPTETLALILSSMDIEELIEKREISITIKLALDSPIIYIFYLEYIN